MRRALARLSLKGAAEAHDWRYRNGVRYMAELVWLNGGVYLAARHLTPWLWLPAGIALFGALYACARWEDRRRVRAVCAVYAWSHPCLSVAWREGS